MTALHNSPTPAARTLSVPAYERTSDRLSPTTRHLCSAPFLIPGFADAVVHELIGEQQRSVPPSHGFDLDPVIRQCFRVRRLTLARDGLNTLLYLSALLLQPTLVLTVTLMTLAARRLRTPALRKFLRRHRLLRFLAWFVSLTVASWLVVAFPLITASSADNFTALYVDPDRLRTLWTALTLLAIVLINFALSNRQYLWMK